MLVILLSAVFGPPSSLAVNDFIKTRLPGEGEGPWQITAKTLSYIEETYIAEGDVVITKDGQFLYAQKAVYNTKTGVAEVSGGVRLESGGDILTGESGLFDLNKQTGKLINGYLFLKENHYYLGGGVMEKVGEDTYLIKDCRLTTCDGPKPVWTITGSEVRVTVEGYGKVKHAAFRVRGLPLLYAPYMIFPAKTKRQSGLLPPRIGHSSRNGIDAEVPFYWAASDQTDFTFYQRFMSKRGYMQGLEFRYLAGEDSEGVFLFDIISDREDKDMNDPDEVELSPYDRTNSTRYWLRARADQDLPFGLTARLDADYVSDQDYLNEFEDGLFGFEARSDLEEKSGRPVEEKRSPLRRTALRVDRNAETYAIQALAGYHQLPENPSEDPTAEPLAGLNFILLPDRVTDFPMFFGLESNYDYVWRDAGQKGHRFALSPELRFPLWLGRYLEFESSFGCTYNAQWLDDPGENPDRQSKKAYEARARLSTSVERIYDLGWRNVRRLKHKMSPVLSYEYRDHLDEKDYRPWFEPIDEVEDINQISFSLEHYLDARLENEKGEVTYRQWATLNLTQGYDIDEARRHGGSEGKKEPFLPLSAALVATPFPDLDLRGDIQWDHYDHEIPEASLSLELFIDRSGGRRDTYKVDYLYNREDDRKALDFWLNVNLAYGFSLGSSLERDLEAGQNISNRYWLEYLSQCWGIRFAAEKEDEETSIEVVFRLLGLGDIKAW